MACDNAIINPAGEEIFILFVNCFRYCLRNSQSLGLPSIEGHTIPSWRSYFAAFSYSGDINLHQVRLLDSFSTKYFLIIALVSYFWEVVSPDFFCWDLDRGCEG
ncbi:hypothetical protein CEXT_674901 [Caerostris extrusa]|uniref:Uncharacterized protein n=1 Tax=Caerostris extrusa TaxID=172846 RepID=A0AAV4MMI0_CAEEX|nr:hypothetical protein CEXT_674901 [Caerostris extrusa]